MFSFQNALPAIALRKAQDADKTALAGKTQVAEFKYLELFRETGNPLFMYQASICQMSLGRLREGAYNYGNRWYLDSFQKFRGEIESHVRNWLPTLSDLTGKRTLVIREQGFGDELVFSRAWRKLAEQHDLTIVAPDELVDLFAFNHPNIQFTDTKILSYVPAFADWDWIVTAGDLFCLYIQHYGAPESYLIKAETPVETPYDVAICHAGSRSPVLAIQRREVDPNVFKRMLVDKSVVDFTIPVEDLPWCRCVGGDLHSFMDTANNLAGAKEVLTVDTALAHLAYMMGKPVTVLHNGHVGWWYRSGLYPGIKLQQVLICQ